MFVFMVGGGPSAIAESAPRRVILVGVDDSAEAEAAARWALQEAELRKVDLLLVHANEVPMLPPRGKATAQRRGREGRQALLDKITGTLALPPQMHLDQLVAVDTAESLLARHSERAELTVLGHDHPALAGHMPFGRTASAVASMSRRPVVAVPRGWIPWASDLRPVAVAIDGRHACPAPFATRSPRRACAGFRSLWCTLHRWLSCRPESRTRGSTWRRS